MQPQLGDFVRVRDRRWLVEGTEDVGEGLQTITLAGIDDDTLGEQIDVVWAAELDAKVLKHDDWPSLLGDPPEDPGTFAAYLRTIYGVTTEQTFCQVLVSRRTIENRAASR